MITSTFKVKEFAYTKLKLHSSTYHLTGVSLTLNVFTYTGPCLERPFLPFSIAVIIIISDSVDGQTQMEI